MSQATSTSSPSTAGAPGPRVRRLRAIARALAATYVFAHGLLAGATGGSLITTRIVPGLALVAAGLLIARAPRPLVVAPLVVAAGFATVHPVVHDVGPPIYAVGALAFALAVLYRPRVVLVSVVGGGIAYIALRSLVVEEVTLPRAADDVVMTASVAVFVSVLLHVLEGVSNRSDAAERARLETELGSAIDTAEQERQRHLHHLLHDDVVAALRSVADGSRQPTARLREVCRRTANAIRYAERQADLPPGDLGDLATSAASHTRLRLQPIAPPAAAQHEPVTLDEQQRASLGRALGEALRNVERHTDEDAVAIGWWSADGTHVLQIHDDGPGLGDATPGWGRRYAIEGAMRDIGGEATLTSSPDGGTTVELRWPTTREPELSGLADVHQQTMRAVSDDRIVLVIALLVLPAQIYLAARYLALDYSTPGLLYAVALVATILAVAQRLRHHHLGPATLVLLPLALALVAAAFTWPDPQVLSSYESWYIGMSAQVTLFAAAFVPLRWLAPVLVPLPAAVVAALYADPAVTLSDGGGALMAAVSPPLCGYVIGAVLRESGRELAEQTDQLAATTRRVQRERLADRGRRQPAGFVSNRVAQWLDDVAEGRCDPADADVRRQAHLLSLEVRDELTLPGMLDETLRLRISDARHHGTGIELTRPDGVPTDPGPTLRLLDRLLDHRDELASMVVRLPTTTTAGEVALLPGLADDRIATALPALGGRHQVRRDEFSTVITVGDAASPANTGRADPPPGPTRDDHAHLR